MTPLENVHHSADESLRKLRYDRLNATQKLIQKSRNTLQKRAKEKLAGKSYSNPEGMQAYYEVQALFAQHERLQRLLRMQVNSTTDSERAFQIDSDHAVKISLAVPVKGFSLPEAMKITAATTGMHEATTLFLDELGESSAPLIGYKRNLIQREENDETEIINRINTRLKEVYFECRYPPYAEWPVRSIVVTPIRT